MRNEVEFIRHSFFLALVFRLDIFIATKTQLLAVNRDRQSPALFVRTCTERGSEELFFRTIDLACIATGCGARRGKIASSGGIGTRGRYRETGEIRQWRAKFVTHALLPLHIAQYVVPERY